LNKRLQIEYVDRHLKKNESSKVKMKIEEKQILEIKEKISKIETKRDLLNLLNYTKKLIYGSECKPFSLKQLNYFSNPAKCNNRYSTFSVKKKSGGERQINSPIKGLKMILRVLNTIFQCCSESHKAANGFVLNKSIVTNAHQHIGKQYVYNIDLKDFFHSFDRNRVKMALLKEPFSLNGDKEPLAFFIASLCTHPLLLGDGLTKIVLPQGSPTSPTLTNILCVTLDRRLNGLAKKLGADYSRYADDITFSSHHNIFGKEDFQKELKRIIEEDQSLRINVKKTRLQKTGFRKEVTGLTVNDKVNVQKRYVKQIRMWIYYWEKYGYLRAQQLFVNDYKKDKGHIVKGQPNLVNVLSGKLDFLKMVKGADDSTYFKLKRRFDRLVNSNGNIKLILDLWEKDGIEAAMEKYYLGYVKIKSKPLIFSAEEDFCLDDEFVSTILNPTINKDLTDEFE
jgi:hypothetical protein